MKMRLPSRQLEIGDLEEDRQRLQDEDAGQREEQELLLDEKATTASVPPSDRAPTSPMKTWAGWQLNQRKPRQAPVRAPTKTVSSAAGRTRAMLRYWDHRAWPGDVGQGRQGRGADQGQADGQAVQAVGQVDGVGRADEDEHDPGQVEPAEVGDP